MCAERERQLARARRAHPGTAHALRAHTRDPTAREDSKGGENVVPISVVLGFHGPNTIHTIDGYNPPRTERTEPQHPASKQPSPAARFFLYRICRACALTQCHALVII